MVGINSIKPVIDLFVTKTGSKFVTRPETVSVFKSDLTKLRPAFDTFERSTKTITVDEVKKLFPTGKFSENNYLVREMKNVLSRIEPKPKKVIDLSPELTTQDYKLITDIMNLHNGKYIDVWKGYSDTDLIPNIEKLALFNRSMKLSKQADDFLQFNPAQWDIVVDGIVRKPKDAIIPLLEYKVNSDEINKALSSGEITADVQKKIDAITTYLNLFETKKDITVYRGEKSFGLFDIVKTPDNIKLSDILKFYDNHLISSNFDESSINYANKLVNTLIVGTKIKQSRFLSTAMQQKATEQYAKKVFWKIKVPSGTKGASIESFNIERTAEAEFLMQRGSSFKINNITYNKRRKIWEFEAEIEQLIDKIKMNDSMNVGV